jgi:protein-S-isoprenylcysteine O-methyltransferase Ste14
LELSLQTGSIKVLGPYRLVRHPVYAGYTMTHIGHLPARPSLANAGMYMLALTLLVVRILRGECILKQDVAYRGFAARVHYRLLSGIL